MKNQKALLDELRAQDEELNKIFARREEIAKLAKEAGDYDKMWNKLHADKKSHWEF